MQQDVGRQIFRECKAMLYHALADGKKVPDPVLSTIEAFEAGQQTPTGEEGAAARPSLNQLGRIHHQLSQIVAPALAGTLLLMREEAEKHPYLCSMGSVPLVRRMTTAAFISLLAFVGLSTTKYISGDPDNFSILANKDGVSLLVNELFLLASAAMGASFYALYRANHYLERGTYDSDFEPSYWIQFTLGLMAGMILATILPIGGTMNGIATMKDVGGNQASIDAFKGLGKPLLALAGGFSAGAVYRILNQVVSAIESLVRGDVRAQAASQQQVLQANFAEREVQSRIQLTTRLAQLQQQIDSSSNPEDLRKQLGELQQELLGMESLQGQPPSPSDSES